MEKQKILVVDDERDMRIFVSTVVETHGFEAVAASHGAAALTKAGSNPSALVILDVMMPKIEDGIQTYRQFRTDPRLSAIAKKTFLHSIKITSPRQGPQLSEPEAYMEKPPQAQELIEITADLIGSSQGLRKRGERLRWKHRAVE